MNYMYMRCWPPAGRYALAVDASARQYIHVDLSADGQLIVDCADMLGAMPRHRERVRRVEPVTREAVVAECDRLDAWPHVRAEETHVGHVAGVVLRHQRLQAPVTTHTRALVNQSVMSSRQPRSSVLPPRSRLCHGSPLPRSSFGLEPSASASVRPRYCWLGLCSVSKFPPRSCLCLDRHGSCLRR